MPDLAEEHRAYIIESLRRGRLLVLDIFTTDRRDFAIYRIKGRRRFEVLPS